MDHALHAFRLENEKKQFDKIEERKKKNEAKRKEMLVDQVGEKGEVKAMTIKYKGSFSLPDFKPDDSADAKDEDMNEAEEDTSWVKSQRKKNGMEISRR